MDRTIEPKSRSGKDGSSGWLAKKAQAPAPIRTREHGNGSADIGTGAVPLQQSSPLQVLRHALGNQGFGRFIQAKLTIGQPGDRFEQEADRVADQVMRMPDPAGPAPVTSVSEGTRVQRICQECEEEMQKKERIEEPLLKSEEEPVLRAKAVSGSVAAGPHLESRVNVMRDNGEPLPVAVRDFFEPRFGHDFSQVRIHTDGQAAATARAVEALAYTTGQNIVFGAGQYAPTTAAGQRLLAHELTHVLQQSTTFAAAPKRLQRQAADSVSPPPAANGGLSDEMLRQIARRLREAMAGWGTDEEAIYSSLAGRTKEQGDAIARVYQQLYNRELVADLQDELTDSELQHLGIFAPSDRPVGAEGAAASAADFVALQLEKAMRGWGTDEESIFAALTGRTETERREIKAAYQRLTHRGLEVDLRDELSGADLVTAIRLLNQGLLAPEDELYLAMAGLGTDEATIFRVLGSLAGSRAAIEQMEANYRSKYGDLIADLRSDLSGAEYARALRVLGPVIQDVAFEDCGATVLPQVRLLIPVGIQKVERAIAVLSKGLSGMTTAEMAQFTRFFDPSNSGGIDQGFVQAVLENYRKIRREFANDLTVECETNAGLCTDGQLYYTYWSNIHVCPYFTTESDNVRKARNFVHELAHNAMMAVDRPYYSPGSTEYQALTPRGPWTAQIPVVGPLFRVISRSDTLYHPDAYSWFAFEVP